MFHIIMQAINVLITLTPSAVDQPAISYCELLHWQKREINFLDFLLFSLALWYLLEFLVL